MSEIHQKPEYILTCIYNLKRRTFLLRTSFKQAFVCQDKLRMAAKGSYAPAKLPDIRPNFDVHHAAVQVSQLATNAGGAAECIRYVLRNIEVNLRCRQMAYAVF